MDQWLVRTSENRISGPYTREKMCQMILDRQLTLQDEVCEAHGYWIFLHEQGEIFKFLGIEVPKALTGSEEEVTETQIENLDSEISDASLENTAVFSTRRPIRRVQKNPIPSIQIVGESEPLLLGRKRLWFFLGAFGIFLILLFVLARQ